MDEPDYTSMGDIEYRRNRYEIIQQALTILRDEVRHWNDVAIQHGAVRPPYESEEDWLTTMMDWGHAKLADQSATRITVNGISVHSLRLQRAALEYAAAKSQKDIAKKAVGLPPSVARAMLAPAEAFAAEAQTIKQAPHEILDEMLHGDADAHSVRDVTPHEWDVFVSHASEDKEVLARPLVKKLQQAGLSVWFDESELTVGDSLRRSIDRGLARSRFGVVILSRPFFSKHWPQQELDGLAAKEVDGVKVILPVWHGVDRATVAEYSPMLADRMAAMSDRGLDEVTAKLLAAIRRR